MRTVGLFGGSFDPPHVGHLLAAQLALEDHVLDELWFVPVYVHPSGKRLTPYAHRVAMCELASCALEAKVRVSLAEAHIGPCVTLDVLDHLARRHPTTRFRLVMGSDLVRRAASWPGWNELARRAPPLVIARGADTPTISSTEIRAALADGAFDVAAALLPQRVLRYIASRGLYAQSPVEAA